MSGRAGRRVPAARPGAELSPSRRVRPGSFSGGLSALPAHELGAAAIREVLRRAGLSPGEVSEVILGQVLTAGTYGAGGAGWALPPRPHLCFVAPWKQLSFRAAERYSLPLRTRFLNKGLKCYLGCFSMCSGCPNPSPDFWKGCGGGIVCGVFLNPRSS